MLWLFKKHVESLVYYICTWWFFLMQIVIFTLKLSDSSVGHFFEPMILICVLSANSRHFKFFFELRKLARVAHFTQPLVQRLTGYKVHCRLKTSEKNFLKPFKKVEFTDSDRVVSDNLELLWSWTLVGSPVRIIRIFAIHTGIFPASIADPVSVIVVKILYLCQ